MDHQSSAAPGSQVIRAFVLVTSLFFMWGFSYGLLDVLNKHFQETLGVTIGRSAYLQMAYFGAYFVVAMPAAALATRWGYKAAILTGLCLFAVGALLIVPATLAASFPFYLAAFFVIASGLGCLETAANPYVTLLGDAARGEQRINLSQFFNGLGQFAGPRIGGYLIFSSAAQGGGQDPVRLLYVALAAVVLVLAVLFWRTPMPEPQPQVGSGDTSALWSRGHFAWGVVAQFFYVAAQVGIGTFFINYVTGRDATITNLRASELVSYGLLLFMIGRFVGTAAMSWIAPRRLLTAYALINIALSLVVVAAEPRISLAALIALFFFMSIMFPTIFALAIRDLGAHTKRASSYLIMSIVGGALVPRLMGWIGDHHGIALAYLVPAGCFAIVAIYGWKLAVPAHSRSA